jgi:nucleoside-diphosphate-sugar epimerase
MELADIVCTFFPQVECKFQQGEINGLKRGTLSVEKAKSVLGYVPEYSLENGVENYIDFIKLHGDMI